MNIVIPMAGRGSRFTAAGFKRPKPLVQLLGKPMIELVVTNLEPNCDHTFIFVCLDEHLKVYPELEPFLRGLSKNVVIVPIDGVTQGAACTVLCAEKFINNDTPLIIANSDQFIDFDQYRFYSQLRNSLYAGHIMTFFASDPKWSYVSTDEYGNVVRVVEKEVISNQATTGIYHFSKGANFVHYAKQMIECNDTVNGEFYVAPTYNYMIRDGLNVVPVEVDGNESVMYGLGTPEDLSLFMTSGLFLQMARKWFADR
jgi:NDP-sugar pyrophosphorylase family protein